SCTAAVAGTRQLQQLVEGDVVAIELETDGARGHARHYCSKRAMSCSNRWPRRMPSAPSWRGRCGSWPMHRNCHIPKAQVASSPTRLIARLAEIHAGVAAGAVASRPAKPTTTSSHMIHQGSPHRYELSVWKRSRR